MKKKSGDTEHHIEELRRINRNIHVHTWSRQWGGTQITETEKGREKRNGGVLERDKTEKSGQKERVGPQKRSDT